MEVDVKWTAAASNVNDLYTLLAAAWYLTTITPFPEGNLNKRKKAITNVMAFFVVFTII